MLSNNRSGRETMPAGLSCFPSIQVNVGQIGFIAGIEHVRGAAAGHDQQTMQPDMAGVASSDPPPCLSSPAELPGRSGRPLAHSAFLPLIFDFSDRAANTAAPCLACRWTPSCLP